MSASSKPDTIFKECRACIHFQSRQMTQLREVKTGQCRCFPPQVTRFRERNGDICEEYAWPVVRAKDWCGQYAEVELDETL